jgi:hypothetical protein
MFVRFDMRHRVNSRVHTRELEVDGGR